MWIDSNRIGRVVYRSDVAYSSGIKRAKSKIEKDGALAGLRMNSYRTYVRCYHRISRKLWRGCRSRFLRCLITEVEITYLKVTLIEAILLIFLPDSPCLGLSSPSFLLSLAFSSADGITPCFFSVLFPRNDFQSIP